MRKIILYVAMSLDGYIADTEGKVDWLTGQNQDAQTEDGYEAFIQEVDTVLLGWRTYHQIVTELSPEQWVYKGLHSYVFTHRSLPAQDGVDFISEAPWILVARLKERPGRDVWVCGGAELVRQLMNRDLIDIYRISVIPTILGQGVRLFPEPGPAFKLRLVSQSSANGIVELVYHRRSTSER